MKNEQTHFSKATLVAMKELKQKLQNMNRQNRKIAFAFLKLSPSKF